MRHHLPGASFAKAEMVFAWVCLPIRNSLIMTGMPIRAMQMR